MNKNDIVRLEITDLTGGGDGISHAEDGRVVFVPNTAVGDIIDALIIKVKPKYALGIIKQIVTQSKNRIESDCDISSKCGGCVFRHISYEKECDIKYNQVKSSLNRIGGIDIVPQQLLSATNPDRYRNKAQFPVGTDKFGKVVCGFFTKSSHRIATCKSCKLQPECFDTILNIFCEWANKHELSAYSEITGKGILRHLYLRYAQFTNEIMVVVVVNSTKLPHSDELIELLKNSLGQHLKSVQININREKTNVVLGKHCELLYGENYITDVICNVKIRISALSFYQVNRNMAEKLYTIAAEFAEPKNKTVLDLYCGAGAIGLSMAKCAKKIIGVEIVEQAISDAKINAELNAIDNAEFLCADATKASADLNARDIHPEVVVLDPPRKGCEQELLNIVANSFTPQRIVYISCNDATLARDCAIFKDMGYEVKKAVPIDLFPRTGHVETVALLTKSENL